MERRSLARSESRKYIPFRYENGDTKKEQWSPKQIAGRLKKEGCNISHETIYAMIRKDESGELGTVGTR